MCLKLHLCIQIVLSIIAILFVDTLKFCYLIDRIWQNSSVLSLHQWINKTWIFSRFEKATKIIRINFFWIYVRDIEVRVSSLLQNCQICQDQWQIYPDLWPNYAHVYCCLFPSDTNWWFCYAVMISTSNYNVIHDINYTKLCVNHTQYGD